MFRGVFEAEFENAECNSYDPKQKFLINRYILDTEKKQSLIKEKKEVSPKDILTQNNKGFYTEVIFRPLNAYLDYSLEESGTGDINGIGTFQILTRGSRFTPEEATINRFRCYQ